MPNSREVRRICGFLSARQSRLHLERVLDPRDRRGRRWRLDTLLFTTLLGVMTGQKSFADVEQLTENLSVAARHLLGIHRSVPDTTLRDALSTVEPEQLRPILHLTTRSAHRSKSLSVDFDLPFGVVSRDGKYVSVPAVDDRYSQLVTHDTGKVAKRCGVGVGAAYYWAKQEGSCRGKRSAVQEVKFAQLVRATAEFAPTLEVKIGRATIRVAKDFDPEHLGRLVEALGGGADR